MSKPIEKTFQYLGKSYKYTTPASLGKKLKLTTNETKKLLEKSKRGTMFAYLTDKEGNVARQNLKLKPLVARNFGLKRINNKTILKDNFTNYKGITISSKLPKSKPINLAITITADIIWSEDFERKTFQVNKLVSPNKINSEYLESLVREHYSLDEQEIKLVDTDFNSSKTDQKFSLDFMGLRRSKPLDISNLYNEVIDNKDGNCIQDYLGKIYKKFSKKEISTLQNVNDLYNYAFKHNIKMIAYDINGNVIKSYYPTKRNSNRKNLIFIAYDSHLYPLKNTLLKKVKPLKDYNIIHSTNLKDKLIEFLEQGILPRDVRIYAKHISSFQIGNDLYLDNPDYEICKDILSKFGLLDKLSPLTSLSSIGGILEKLFIKQNIDSFIPANSIYVKGGFNYHNDKLKYTKDFITMDKTKAYSYSLSSLEYLITTDYKCCNIKTKNINKIVPHYLYIVEPKKSTILLDNENVYSGEHLIYCKKEGVEFKIKEEIECDKKPNYYKELIEKLYKFVDPKYAKQIINIMIGKMERYSVDSEFNEFHKILGKDELETFTGFTEPLNDDYCIGYKPITRNNIINKKPINIQVKDKARVLIYEMMKKLNIDDKKDLLQIKTDSITFKPKNNDYKKYINKELSGWKLEEYKPIKNKTPYKTSHSFILTAPDDDESFLGEQLAGGGKTYTIMNDIVPKLDKSYIIISPSHVSISEYRNKGYNCNVIQKYLYRKLIPKEDIIIVDEIGMIGNAGWNILYMAKLLGKRIIAYGDFKQLKPVGAERLFNKDHWLNLMFKTIDTKWINRRNNFTEKYYMDLFNTNIDIKKEVEKHSTDLHKTEYVLCYFNETRKKYNEIICKNKGIKSMTNKDALIMCKTNDLRDKEIYNNYVFKVVESNRDEITLFNVDFKNYVELSKEEIHKNFDYAYARTLYNIQGQTINSYYWCKEDNRALDGRSAYTIISRLKK